MGHVVKNNLNILMREKRESPHRPVNHINPSVNVNQMPQRDALKANSSVFYNNANIFRKAICNSQSEHPHKKKIEHDS